MKKVILALIICVTCVAPAFAAPVLSTINDIYFNNVENWMDLNRDGFVSAGDKFYGILHVQNIDSPTLGGIWGEDNIAAGGIDTLTGYFLTDVVSTKVEGLTYHIELGASASDPNGIMTSGDLASKVVMKLFADSSYTPYYSGTVGSFADHIATAVDGSLWASLNFGSTGYWYTHAPIIPPTQAGDDVGDSYFGLNLVENFSGSEWLPINDPLESEANGTVSIYGKSNIDVSSGSKTKWMFTSNDPSHLETPEPATMVMFGLGLAGLFGLKRKKTA